jgi:hypothetical protein
LGGLAKDKQSGLKQVSMNYDRKKLHNIGPWSLKTGKFPGLRL